MKESFLLFLSVLLTGMPACAKPGKTTPAPDAIKPRVITEPTKMGYRRSCLLDPG